MTLGRARRNSVKNPVPMQEYHSLMGRRSSMEARESYREGHARFCVMEYRVGGECLGRATSTLRSCASR